MAITVLILCGAAEAFLLCCLFEVVPVSRSKHPSDENLWSEARKSNIVPLQLGPASVEFWSQGTWDRFLSTVGSSHSAAMAESETNRDYDVAA